VTCYRSVFFCGCSGFLYIVYTFDYLFMDRSYAYKFKWLIDNDYIVALYVIVSK
jgi:hypothetical protein